jgi:hypothetical protein
MRLVGTFDPATATTKEIDVGAADPGSKLLMYNRSLVDLVINFENGSTDVIHACEAKWWSLDGYTPTITWTSLAVLNTLNPAISQVTVILYNADEEINGNYPMTLIYQTNIGNQVSTVGTATSAQQIINDGNASGQQIIEATPVGSPGSTWLAENDGTFTVAEYMSATLTKLLQILPGNTTAMKLAALNRTVEILGSLLIDQNLTVTGTTTHTGAVTATNAANNILASNVPASGIQSGTLASGVTVPGGQVSGSVAAANTLNGNTNLPGGTLGKSADGDILDASGTSTYLKGSNKVDLQVPAGTDRLYVNSTGVFVPGGAIYGTDSSNSIIAASGTAGTGNMRVQNTDLVSIQVPGGTTQVSITSTDTKTSNVFTALNNFFLTNGKTNQIGTNNIVAAASFGITFTTTVTTNHNYRNGTPNVVTSLCNTSGSTATVGVDSITPTQITLRQGSGTSLRFIGLSTAC